MGIEYKLPALNKIDEYISNMKKYNNCPGWYADMSNEIKKETLDAWVNQYCDTSGCSVLW
ncbi:hypothetical protein ACFL1H_06470 [Nanoarchaeota archaeon]